MPQNMLQKIANSIPIKYARYKDKDDVERKCIFIGHEKAIYGADGERLDNKIVKIEDSISDAFSPDKDYTTGDYCTYLNRLYKFTQDKLGGVWDGSVVVPVSVGEELLDAQGNIGQLNNSLNAINKLVVIDGRNGESFAGKLNVNYGYATFFVFYTNPSGNPFSFANGAGISLRPGILYGSGSALLIAADYAASKIETKTINF